MHELGYVLSRCARDRLSADDGLMIPNRVMKTVMVSLAEHTSGRLTGRNGISSPRISSSASLSP